MRGSVQLVSERPGFGNPVVRLPNGIRSQCVRESGHDFGAPRSRLHLPFSLRLASSL